MHTMSTTVPVTLTPPNLQLWIATATSVVEQELGRPWDVNNPQDLCGAILVAIALNGGTVDTMRQWIRQTPEWRQRQERPTPPAPPLPPRPQVLPKPTRDQLLHARTGFGGEMVSLLGYGTIPWFDAAFQSLGQEGRQTVYQMKRQQGDQVILACLWWAYQARDYTYPVGNGIGIDFSNDFHGFKSLVTEIIDNGFYPQIMCACEGQGRVTGQLGYPYAMARVPELVDVLQQDRNVLPWCRLCLGFELLGPGGDWTPDQLIAAHLQLRRAAPDAVIALELGQGYNKWQEDGVACWASEAGRAIDLLLQEFTQPINILDRESVSGCCQLARRSLGSAYTGPLPPVIDDAEHVPWYMSTPTPRGPHAVAAWEYGLFDWVRRPDPARYQEITRFLQSLGYTIF
jgi:hypothetical protein